MGVTDNVESLILEQLRRISQRMDKKDIEDLETKMRLTSIDEHLGGVMMSVAGINNRLDRIEERVGRIERRLDLTEQR
jgi:archaellum component FlaC